MSSSALFQFERQRGSGVYFLGSFARRVTVLSQQVRAMTLAHALIAEGRLPSKGRVAVIGGGIAGLTAAAALKRLGHELAAIDVFETKDELVHLQSGSDSRYLHPHVYDWPFAGSFDDAAGLPIMDWRAGSAAEVADSLKGSFGKFREGNLQVYTDARVRRIRLRDGVPGGHVHTAGATRPRQYDAIVVAVGFGYERTGGQSSSYWDVSPLIGPLRTAERDPEILVSGNGDGGLVDFALAVAKISEHRDLVNLFRSDPDFRSYAAAARTAEEDALGSGTPDILQAYCSVIVPATLLLKAGTLLRQDAKVTFHTRDAMTLRADTSFLNRLAVHLLAAASERRAPGRVRIFSGVPIIGDPFGDEWIRIGPDVTIRPHRRFLRFGSDRKAALKPFADALPRRDRYALDPDTATPRLMPEVDRALRPPTVPGRPAIQVVPRTAEPKARAVVLATAYPFLAEQAADWRANLMLGSLLHEQVSIPGSLALRDSRVGSLIVRNPELLTCGALALDLREGLANFSQYASEILEGGTSDQKRLAELLDQWCPKPLRFSARGASEDFRHELRDLADRAAASVPLRKADPIRRARERLEQVPDGGVSRQAALDAFAGTRLAPAVQYLYSTCGARSLNADIQIPDHLFSSAIEHYRRIDLHSASGTWTQQGVRELLALDQHTLAGLSGADVARLREQGLVDITRRLLQEARIAGAGKDAGQMPEIQAARDQVLDRVGMIARTENVRLREGLGEQVVGAVDPEVVPFRDALAPLTVFVESVRDAALRRLGVG